MPPFRLLYDLRWMELGQAGGVEQAARELISTISLLDRRNAYQIFAPRSACYEWDFPRGFDVELLLSDADDDGAARLQSRLSHRHAEVRAGRYPPTSGNFAGPQSESPRHFDLVHSLCSYIHPDLIDVPGIVTVHDLQHRHYPEFFSPHDWEDRERLYRTSVEIAQHVICISEFTRQDVHRQYGIPLEKMTTIWNIPGRGVWRNLPEGEVATFLREMGLGGPFLLYPAHNWPHKNHLRLVEAFSRIEGHLPRDIQLVFTGNPFAPDHPASQLIRTKGLAGRVIHLGYRSPLEMRALFQGCLGLVFPSLFEGFGVPVAEAIISGKPVVCSNVTSLPEIAGDAALMFDPADEDEMGARILELCTSTETRERLSRAARARRGIFSATSNAVKTLSVYQRVHEDLVARHAR
jgi:glycosyltransferase involved in cell wall biosynthesis